MHYRDRITFDPNKMSGKAFVRDLGFTVQEVLDYVASGAGEAELIARFPGLVSEDILACNAFANDRISGIRDITAEHPSAEIWKYLRFFTDKSSTAERIRLLHGIQPGSQTKNIAKQSQQIAFCIRQAEQYFNASTQVGLPTRPVLLYYGAVSLSQALILLKNDGTYSLDVRRNDSRHNHHGLELRRGLVESAARATGPQSFLEKIECFCHVHNKQLWGHFPLFYRSLAPPVIPLHAEILVARMGSFLERDIPTTCADLWTLDSIAQGSLNAWEIFKGLPDLYWSLSELGITSNLCRGSAKRQIRHSVAPQPLNGVDDLAPGFSQAHSPKRVQFQDSFFVDGVTPDQKELLLAFYREKNPAIKVVDDHGANIHLSLTLDGPDERSVLTQIGYYPDITEDLAGRKYYIIQPDGYIPEPAAILALLFCFSMLCRYYPDVWMRSIDENVRMAELTNVFLNIAYRKFPNLILDQLTLTKHKIHP